jgi:hypothetical protein
MHILEFIPSADFIPAMQALVNRNYNIFTTDEKEEHIRFLAETMFQNNAELVQKKTTKDAPAAFTLKLEGKNDILHELIEFGDWMTGFEKDRPFQEVWILQEGEKTFERGQKGFFNSRRVF